MKYRIVHNGREYRLQHGVRLLWFTLWFLGGVPYRTKSEAEDMLKFMESIEPKPRIGTYRPLE